MSEIILTDADDELDAVSAPDGGCLKCGKPEKDQSLETGFGGYRRLICKNCGNEVNLAAGGDEA